MRLVELSCSGLIDCFCKLIHSDGQKETSQMKFTAALTTKSGNLFDDVHFKTGTASLFKKELADRITTRLEERGMTVASAAQKLDCTQADVKRIRRSDVMRFSVEEMVSLARTMGYRVNVRIEVPKAGGPESALNILTILSSRRLLHLSAKP